MAIGYSLNPELCHQEGATSWQSSLGNWSTKGALHRHKIKKRCIKRGFGGIHVRFQKDFNFRDLQLRIDRTEASCIQMDEVAQKDFTYRLSPEEYERSKKTWSISLNTSGRNAPMKLRSDFSEALTKMHRLHRESGEERLAPIPFWQYQKWHPSFSSSSTSWWQWNDHWWSL